MTPSTPPVPYRVSYSGRVRERLTALADVARARGDGAAYVAALREFDRRLALYPQFGDPLSDLQQEVGQIRLDVIHPLVMRYGVYEEHRMVSVVALPVLMQKARNRSPE